MLLDGRWKGVRLKPGAPVELYDLATDLAEEKNIAAEHPTELARIETALRTTRSDSPDWPMRDGAPRKATD